MISPEDFEQITNYVNSKLENLELSTINLAAYSHFDNRFKNGFYEFGDTSKFKFETKDGRKCLRLKSESDTVGFYANPNHNFSNNRELIGRKFTISFDVYPLTEITNFKIGFEGLSHEHPYTATNKWQRVSYSQFLDPSRFISSNPVFSIYGGDDINDFYISNLSVVEGDYASNYYPSKEDLTIGLMSKNAKGWLDQLLPNPTEDMGSLVFPKGIPKEGYDPDVCHVSFDGNDLILTIHANKYKLTKTAL